MVTIGKDASQRRQLKAGDIIEIEYANRTEKFEVLIIPTGNVSIQSATELYKIIE